MKFDNVFVVDDDKVHHFIIKKLLEKNNIEVTPFFFENGFDALNDLKVKLESGGDFPDLILLDINMPVLDGWQFLEEFSAMQKGKAVLKDVVIHIISSSDNDINAEKLEEFKSLIESYYVKPMTSESIKTIFI